MFELFPSVCLSAAAAEAARRRGGDGGIGTEEERRREDDETGRQFNRKNVGLSFGLKNGLRFHFDSETSLYIVWLF